MSAPVRLAAEIRRIRTEQYTKWFAYGIALFTLFYFLGQFAR